MKKKSLLVLISFVLSSLLMTSCEELLSGLTSELTPPTTQGGVEIAMGWSEDGSHLYYRASVNSQSELLWDFVMEEGLCKEAILNYQFASVMLANIFYESLKNDETYGYEFSIAHNLVIVDMTPDFKGKTKEQIQKAFEKVEGGEIPDQSGDEKAE